MSDIESRVRAIICEQRDVPEDQVTPQARFIDDLDFDSLDIFDLVQKLEDEFEVSIPDEDAENILSVGDAIKYIQDAA